MRFTEPYRTIIVEPVELPDAPEEAPAPDEQEPEKEPTPVVPEKALATRARRQRVRS